MSLKDWEEVKNKGFSKFTRVWQRKDGIVGGILNNTKYPFISVCFEGDGWNFRIIHYTNSEGPKNFKTKQKATDFAKQYMEEH